MRFTTLGVADITDAIGSPHRLQVREASAPIARPAVYVRLSSPHDDDAMTWLTPDQARTLAARLVEVANETDRTVHGQRSLALSPTPDEWQQEAENEEHKAWADDRSRMGRLLRIGEHR